MQYNYEIIEQPLIARAFPCCQPRLAHRAPGYLPKAGDNSFLVHDCARGTVLHDPEKCSKCRKGVAHWVADRLCGIGEHNVDETEGAWRTENLPDLSNGVHFVQELL